MIKPTAGRILWFHPDPDAGLLQNAAGDPLAAIVVGVNGDRNINLAVFDVVGGLYAFTSVTLLQEDDAVPELGHHAAWMPYQVGQAAKTEKLEQQIAGTGASELTGRLASFSAASAAPVPPSEAQSDANAPGAAAQAASS